MLLLGLLLVTGVLLVAWKMDALRAEQVAAAAQQEPVQVVALAEARPTAHQATVTAIGTVLATRSVTLRNELPGTVAEVALAPGRIVDAGTVLVRLDVSVEQAELEALEAEARLAETLLERYRQASRTRAVSAIEVDRARAELDVALAQIERTKAIIERKTIRAPFRARVGLADVHRGQYLDAGSALTTLQGVDEVAHVDFAVPQRLASQLRRGDEVQVYVTGEAAPLEGAVVAVDSRVDPTTRNATVRARIAGGPPPGASVRVEVPDGPVREAVIVPATALRKGPAGDHVFVIEETERGELRAHLREVRTGSTLRGGVLVLEGLATGERVASSGSFKLADGALVAPSQPESSHLAAAAAGVP